MRFRQFLGFQRLAHFAVALATLTSLTLEASAQQWPAHSLRIVVPFPAGGSADLLTRVIADELSKTLGQSVIVDNKPGAGGNIGAVEAARAQPDGHTLFMGTTGTHASNISLYAKLPYDPIKDFAPLTLVAAYPQVLVPGLKYGDVSLDRLIALLKQAGGSANYGSSGIGSPTHLAAELFKRETGTSMVHVPYRGQGPALNDLLSGQLDIVFPSVPDVFSFVESGKFRAIAIMNERRSKTVPNVPTSGELGYPRLISSLWSGLYTNAGTPKPVIERLSRELVRIIASPVFKDKFEAIGFEVRPSSPNELDTFAASETKRWGEIVKAINIRLD